MEGIVEAGEAADAASASILAQNLAAGGDLGPFTHRVKSNRFPVLFYIVFFCYYYNNE